jgi:hypothetical protein
MTATRTLVAGVDSSTPFCGIVARIAETARR